ncbi:MAG: hypothetical protein IJO52_09805 [Clostridia bacterium]|nr:hypothetical protein [Clostridia bacterium]
MSLKVGLKYIEIWNESLESVVCEYEKEQNNKGEIVFYGPSCFTRWSAKYGETPMRDVLLGKSGKKCVINRGFGSSCAEHQLYYYPRMVRPLAPSVLVYSSYGNGGAFGYTPEESFMLAQRVVAYAKTDFPDIRIYLCGPHYTLNNDAAIIENRNKYASLMREFAEKTPDCRYVDVLACPSLCDDAIFIEDGVHYNKEGYARYADFYRNILKDELERF